MNNAVVRPRVVSSAYFASLLRLELRERSARFKSKYRLAGEFSYGTSPVVVYQPLGERHGNFIDGSYQSILHNPSWAKRLSKVHTSAKSALPKADRKWCELDSCNSSDALLMNIFCYPDVCNHPLTLSLLGLDDPQIPDFGMKARVPLVNGKFDRTEVDMQLGALLIEAKLTESDFQARSKEVVWRYRDFSEVFDPDDLPQIDDKYLGYQLIRNVLAAHAQNCSFCVLCDARRPDLIEQWYAVMRCIRISDLRTRCKMLTWQELSEALPDGLRNFLDEKYGIRPGPLIPYLFEHRRE
jgi:hypothetical protein